MLLDTIQSFYTIKMLHIFMSLSFLFFAVWLFIRSVKGIIKQKSYTKTDKILSYCFIIALYLQLVFGFILFSNLGSEMGFNYQSADSSLKMVSKRLWPIEHIVMMLFALFIANLGLIITLNTKSDRRRFYNTIIYYSISILLIMYSLSAIYLF